MNEVTTATGTGKALYSRGQIWLAGVLGGPLAAAWVARRSAEHLDASETGRHLLWLGVGSLLVLLIAVALLPTDMPNNSVFALIFILPVVVFFDHHLKTRIETAFESGATKHSWWRAAGVGLAGFVVTLVMVALHLTIIPLKPVNTLEYGDNIIYFEGEATEDDARRLAGILETEGVFNPGEVWELALVYPKRPGGRLELHIAFAEPIENTDTHAWLRQLRDVLQTYYDDKNVEIHVKNIWGITTLRIPG